jgi:peptide deformylase
VRNILISRRRQRVRFPSPAHEFSVIVNKIIKERVSTFINVLTEIPEIKYVGDPILRKQTQAVNISEGKLIGDQLGKILLRYRKIAGIGRGLAAPQIGLNKAVFVTFVNEKLQIFINPIITSNSAETNFYRELCLSSGIMAVDVERPERITMEWTDVEGKKQCKKFDGFLARLYQHEEAHLRGIVNLDEAAPQGIEFATRDPLKEKLRKIR